jgi:hypothetical protein
MMTHREEVDQDAVVAVQVGRANAALGEGGSGRRSRGAAGHEDLACVAADEGRQSAGRHCVVRRRDYKGGEGNGGDDGGGEHLRDLRR